MGFGFFKKIGRKIGGFVKKVGKKASKVVSVIGRKAGHTLQKVGGFVGKVGAITGQPEIAALGELGKRVGGASLAASHVVNKLRKGKIERALEDTVTAVDKGKKAKEQFKKVEEHREKRQRKQAFADLNQAVKTRHDLRHHTNTKKKSL